MDHSLIVRETRFTFHERHVFYIVIIPHRSQGCQLFNILLCTLKPRDLGKHNRRERESKPQNQLRDEE